MDRSRVCKEKVADSKISGYVVDGAQEYYSPTTYRAGEALVSTTGSYIFIYVSKHVLVACRLSFNNPFFSLFFVAFQRPSVNEPELNNQLNNNLRLRAFMIVYILG